MLAERVVGNSPTAVLNMHSSEFTCLSKGSVISWRSGTFKVRRHHNRHIPCCSIRDLRVQDTNPNPAYSETTNSPEFPKPSSRGDRGSLVFDTWANENNVPSADISSSNEDAPVDYCTARCHA